MPNLYSTLACNLDRHILTTALPLFQAAKVQALEWAFDTLYQQQAIPDWFEGLLQVFSEQGRLVGHGVYFSIFAGRWSQEQKQWLEHLKVMANRYRFDHVTEHFGFMTGADFHTGAPLGVPYTPTTLAIGQDRLQRIQQAAECPVGLENLAFAYSPDEVWRQGEFLDRLLSPVNGFLILDLHNLYCQLHNFEMTFADLVQAYPLQRVREIHISGGSWEQVGSAPNQLIRRDTHDAGVPEEVFTLLEMALPLVPHLKYVVLEQLGIGLQGIEEQQQYRRDFDRMDDIVQRFGKKQNRLDKNQFLLTSQPLPTQPNESFELHQQQEQLSNILEQADSLQQAQDLLLTSCLANSPWQIEQWSPKMLETAMQIAQKWKRGFQKNQAGNTKD